MEPEKIEDRLKHWKRRHNELMAAYGDLNRLTSAMPDCKLLRPVFDVWMAYTVAVSELIGDREEWLQWYELECDMGKRPKSVVFADGRGVEVKTLRHLAQVIADGANA